MAKVAIIALLLATSLVTVTSNQQGTKVKETYVQKLLRLAYMIESNPEWKEEFERRGKANEDLVLPPIDFTCEVETSPTVPTSVHMLRPSDINVIAAFGDSISAGNGLGARNAPEVAMENRGEVFSVGGDENLEKGVITITNIFRKFNPDIKGYSRCVSVSSNPKSWLNVAEPGGDNTDMPTQARAVIDKMINDSRIDFDNDWKMITMFVGGNDLCASCDNWAKYSPAAYKAKFAEALDILYDEVPRLFVNLVVMFDVTPLSNLSASRFCDAMQVNFCDCAINDTTRPELRNTQMGYYNALKELSEDPTYQGREDFVAVMQPQMRDLTPPIDPNTGDYLEGILAPDCFHPSRVSHQAFSVFLWDAMLTPVGQKPFVPEFVLGETTPVKCPSAAQPYLFTWANSNV